MSTVKHIYDYNKLVYVRLCDKYIKPKQIGGFVLLDSSLIDTLFDKFNVLHDLTMFEKKDNKYDENTFCKRVKISKIYLGVKPINLITRNKHKMKVLEQKFDETVIILQEKKEADTKNIFGYIRSHLKSIKAEKTEEDVDAIIARNIRIPEEKQLDVIKEVERIVGKDIFWRQVYDIFSPSPNHPISQRNIFEYYTPDIINAIASASNVLISDSEGYDLYKKGYISEQTYKSSSLICYEFNRNTFETVIIDDDVKCLRNIARANISYDYDINAPICKFNICLRDLKTLYDACPIRLTQLMRLATISPKEIDMWELPYDKKVDKYVVLNKDIIDFCLNILNVRYNPAGIMNGMFTNKNNLIYTFIRSNTYDIFIQTISHVLSTGLDVNKINVEESDKIINLVCNIPIDTVDVFKLKKLLYIEDTDCNGVLLINKYLYDKFINHLIPIIKSYNYICLTDNYNKYNCTYMSKSIIGIVVDFFNELEKFIQCTIKFKSSLVKYFLPSSYTNVTELETHINNFIVITFLIYIIYDIRINTNIPYNKTQLLDKLTQIQRNFDATEQKVDVLSEEYSLSEEYKTWLENKSTKGKKSFSLIKEYNVNVGKQKFKSCGESMALNIINYALFDEKKERIDVNKLPESATKLKEFYNKQNADGYDYSTIVAQQYDESNTVHTWSEMISNIDGIVYGKNKYELIPTIENITNLIAKLTSGEEIAKKGDFNSIIKMLDNSIKVDIGDSVGYTTWIFDNAYNIRFSQRHGDMLILILDTYYSPHKDIYNMISTAPFDQPLHKLLINRLYDICTKDVLKKMTIRHFVSILPYFNENELSDIFRLDGFKYTIHSEYIDTYYKPLSRNATIYKKALTLYMNGLSIEDKNKIDKPIMRAIEILISSQ